MPSAKSPRISRTVSSAALAATAPLAAAVDRAADQRSHHNNILPSSSHSRGPGHSRSGHQCNCNDNTEEESDSLKVKRLKRSSQKSAQRAQSPALLRKAESTSSLAGPSRIQSMKNADCDSSASRKQSVFASRSSPSLFLSSNDSVNLAELVHNSRKQYQLVESKQQLLSSPRIDKVLHSTFLKPGSCFVGKQLYREKGHEVAVKFKHVDLNQSYLNGYLTIKKLTRDNPEITTFFEAEIIGEKHNFMSRRRTNTLYLHDQVDVANWSKFDSWKEEIYPNVVKQLNAGPSNQDFSPAGFKKALNEPSRLYVHRNFLAQRYIYMRWKEVLLVPDATKNLKSASYDGLYYVRLDQATGYITGYYYHQKSEDQYLELLHVPTGGFSESFEFV